LQKKNDVGFQGQEIYGLAEKVTGPCPENRNIFPYETLSNRVMEK
jgi:hypothetical protein